MGDTKKDNKDDKGAKAKGWDAKDTFELSGSIASYESSRKRLKLKKKGAKWAWQAQKEADKFDRAMVARDATNQFRRLTTAVNDVLSSQRAYRASNGLRGRSALEMENDTLKKAESEIINIHETAYYKGVVSDMELSAKEHEYLYSLASIKAKEQGLKTELAFSAAELAAKAVIAM